ncbi:hypothetical protein Syun_002471 [Stephania yunnanensis]|uniref:Uncharacterized protein n=1 Tax=Stephania yunnanensis TaxID=152371 RepID=A0AAP0LFU3_9MAGN
MVFGLNNRYRISLGFVQDLQVVIRVSNNDTEEEENILGHSCTTATVARLWKEPSLWNLMHLLSTNIFEKLSVKNNKWYYHFCHICTGKFWI